ncbi:MAG: transcription elongation factor GreA [Anaerolineaceae bacterium]|jgi:transcription elongation factor GreA|nr:transcription elongation factor GreA [Anaerolineaceae bacterium]
MNNPSYLTKEGAEKLHQELEQLKGPSRDDLSRRLRLAIQQGDLSENADYIAAKEEQGFLEGRIAELTTILSNVVIIEENAAKKDKVDVGVKVTIQEDDFPEETYFLVGPQEANPAEGRISHNSPIGSALLGHKVGDVVEATTPGGTVKLKITHIE